MATPVVTVASGGMPVVDVTATSPKLGLPVTEALNGRGMPVTKVAGGGMPVTYSTVADYPSGGPQVPGPEASAWLARAVGLDATHIAADTALINGLVADGDWDRFDVFRIYATQNSATALLNMKSSSYAGIANGSPTFTVDRGFTGVNASTTVYIDSQFFLAANGQAGGGQYGQFGNHISCWSVTDAQSQAAMGATNGATQQVNMNLRDTGNLAAFRPGFNPGVADLTVAVANSIGHYIANRSATNAVEGYKNGVSIISGSNAATSVPNFRMYDLAQNASGGAANGSSWQLAASSFGSSLSAAAALRVYNRIRTRLTAVGVP